MNSTSLVDNKLLTQENQALTPPSPLLFGVVLVIVGAIGFSPWVVAKYARETPQMTPMQRRFHQWEKTNLRTPGVSMLSHASRNALELKREGNYEAAIEKFTAMLSSPSNRALNYLARGQCYLNMGRNDLAIADFNQALAINPVDGDALMLRAAAYHRLGQDDKSMADYNAAKQILYSKRR